MNKIEALLKTVKGLSKFNDKLQCLEWYGTSLEKVVSPLAIRLWVKPQWPETGGSDLGYQQFDFKHEANEAVYFKWDDIFPKTELGNFVEINKDMIDFRTPHSPDNKTLIIFKIGQWGILEILGNQNDISPAVFSVIDWLNTSLNDRILLIDQPGYKKSDTIKSKPNLLYDFVCFEIDKKSKSIINLIYPEHQLLGFSKEELLGQPFTRLFVEAEEAESIYNFFNEYETLKNYPVKIKNNKGKSISLLLNAIIEQNKIFGLFSLSNIEWRIDQPSPLLKMEAPEAQTISDDIYKQIIVESPNPVLLLDIERVIQMANTEFVKMSGYKTDEIYGKKPTFLLIKDDSTDNLVAEIRETLIAGQEWQGELQIITKDKKILWHFVHLKPIRNFKGEIVNYIITFENINERKQLEQVLTKARIEAEMASDAKTQFLSIMSHELRNPLSAIVGNIELLESLKTDEATRDTINRLKISSENLKSIIDDILDFSKIEADQIILENEAFNLYATCNNIIASWQPKAEQKKLDLKLEFDQNIRTSVLGDEKRLTQVINNLISNAIKFTESGFILLRCDLTSSKNKYQRVKFTVEDSGIGIAHDRIDKIFNRFIQESASTNRQYGGTGLGLAISKELVEKMGGNLQVDSIKNVGSKFYFELPLHQSQQKVVKQQDQKSEAASVELLKGKTVLMVDDAVFNLQTFSPMIEKWGIKCLTAQDGDLSLEKIKQQGDDIDLILMDLRMPNMNGIEATKLIRKFGWKGPIIAMTGEALKETIDECLEAGMNDYVTKPFKSAELRQKLIKHLTAPGAKLIQQQKTKKSNNHTTMNKKLYDLAGLSNLYDNDEDSIKASVKSFIELMPETLSLLRQRFEAQQWQAFSDAAHKLKTPVRLLRVEDLGEVLQQLEDYTKNGATHEKVPELLEKVETILNKALQQMSDDFK